MNIPQELLASLSSAADEVFDTMGFTPLVRVPASAPAPQRGVPSVLATVAFAGHR